MRGKKTPYRRLINIARYKMSLSRDPIHDVSHVKRVVRLVRVLAAECDLSKSQTDALVLAAWWHDVSRTLTKRPSIVIMPFFDDIISALMLWRETVRQGVFGDVVGTATRMIACKSLGTGKILTKLLLNKKNRIMVDILFDADMLDAINIARTKSIHLLAENSRSYQFGYKLSIWWFLSRERLYVKTDEAQKYLLLVLDEFLAWMKEQDIYDWHVKYFGKKWVLKQFEKSELFMEDLSHAYS